MGQDAEGPIPRTGKRIYRRTAASQWRRKEIPEQRIISDEQWNTVQERMASVNQLCSLDARRPVILRARAVSSPYIFLGLAEMRSLRRECDYCFGMFSEATRRALRLLVALQPRAWCVRKYSSDCEAQSRRATSLGLAGKSSSAAHCRVHAGSLRSGAAARSRLASWLKDLRSLFSAEAVTVRAEIANHVQKIVLMPDGKTYIASGTWDLLTWHGWCRGPAWTERPLVHFGWVARAG